MGTVSSQPPPPNVATAVSPQHEADKEGKEVQNLPSLTTSNSPEGATRPKCPGCEDEADRRGTISRDKRRLWIEFAMLIVGIGGIIGLLCTLRLTRETMVNTERAWIVINDIRGQGAAKKEDWEIVATNNEFKLRLEFVNAGNGPAVGIIVRTGSMFLLDEKQFNCRFEPVDTSSMSVSILAGRGIGNPLFHDLTVKDATPANIELVNAGKKTLLVGGEVEYRDQFDIKRSTSFCSTLTPGGKGLNFTYCRCGNELK